MNLVTPMLVNVLSFVGVDIWGAYRVPAHEKDRYFLIVMDDQFRATWVYLLQCKSQA